MMTLTEFLLARYYARENDIMLRGTSAVWHDETCIYEGGYEGTLSCDCGAVSRALAECEAKRRIVELHLPEEEPSGFWRCSCCREPLRGAVTAEMCATVRLLTLPYADHPDYRPEWRP